MLYQTRCGVTVDQHAFLLHNTVVYPLIDFMDFQQYNLFGTRGICRKHSFSLKRRLDCFYWGEATGSQQWRAIGQLINEFLVCSWLLLFKVCPRMFMVSLVGVFKEYMTLHRLRQEVQVIWRGCGPNIGNKRQARLYELLFQFVWLWCPTVFQQYRDNIRTLAHS